MADLIDIVLALNPVGNQFVNGIVKKQIVNEIEDRGKCPDQKQFEFSETVNWCEKNPIIKAGEVAGKDIGFDKGWIARNMWGFFDKGNKKYSLPPWACLIFGTKPGSVGQFVVACIYAIPLFVDGVFNAAIGAACGTIAYFNLVIRSWGIGFLERWTGLHVPQIRRSLENTMWYICPQIQPHATDAVAAYLHDRLGDDESRAWCQTHGWCGNTWDLNVDAHRWRYSPGFVVQMFYRGCIPTESECKKELRALGILEEKQQENLIACSRPLISVQEAINWYYMLRPGRVEGDLVYTEFECILDITKHGYTGLQARRFIAASRAVIGVRHILNPYYQGKLSYRNVQERLRDSRWRDEDIEEITPFYDYEKQKFLADHAGVPDSRELVEDAAEGYINGYELLDQLRFRGYGPNVISYAIDEAATKRKRQIRKAGIRLIAAELKAGETTPEGAMIALSQYGVQGDEAQAIVTIWKQARSVSAKPVSIGQLCEFFTNGWISYNQYMFGLANLGYGPADQKRIIASCDLKNQVKLAKAMEKAAREEERRKLAAEKAKAAAEKAAAKGKQPPERDNVSGRYIATRLPAAEKLASEGKPEAISELATEISQLEGPPPEPTVGDGK